MCHLIHDHHTHAHTPLSMTEYRICSRTQRRRPSVGLRYLYRNVTKHAPGVCYNVCYRDMSPHLTCITKMCILAVSNTLHTQELNDVAVDQVNRQRDSVQNTVTQITSQRDHALARWRIVFGLRRLSLHAYLYVCLYACMCMYVRLSVCSLCLSVSLSVSPDTQVLDVVCVQTRHDET